MITTKTNTMKNNFTPGAWKIQPSIVTLFEFDITNSDQSEFIAASYENTSKANVNLIAAAPELLEALQSVIRHGLIEHDGYETVLKQVHSAIAKAIDKTETTDL
jgi:hypothetical protein